MTTDRGAAAIALMRARGCTVSELWQYALADWLTCDRSAAAQALLAAGIWPPDDVDGRLLAHAIRGAHSRDGRRRQFSSVQRAELYERWIIFRGEWRVEHNTEATVGRWIAIFRRSVADAAVALGHPAPTDAHLDILVPEATLRRVIRDAERDERELDALVADVGARAPH